MHALPRNQLADAATARDVSLYYWLQNSIGPPQNTDLVPTHVL